MTRDKLIHLDTDIGGDPDDVCALALLLSWPDVELSAITTVTEQEGRRVGYVREVLRLAGRPGIPVAGGARDGINGLRVQPGIPDEAVFWPEPVAPRPNPPEMALDLIDASLARGATVVGIGPYTNLAFYETKYPGKLAQTGLVLMGGYLGPMKSGLPPWGPQDDWNMQLDIDATRIVLEQCRPLLVPMNVTLSTHLRVRDLPRLRAAGSLGALMARQAEANDRIYDNRALGGKYPLLPDDLLNFHHDPLACAVAAGWDGVRIEELPLRVELQDGYLIERIEPGGTRLRVVTDVDGEAFARFWLDLVAPDSSKPPIHTVTT